MLSDGNPHRVKGKMANLFETLEGTARRGAEGLAPDARAALVRALEALRQADGGYAGLDGRSDAYFSFFAWLSLRALGAAYDRAALCGYMRGQARGAKAVEAACADILLAREGDGRGGRWQALAAGVLRGGTREVYAAFMRAMACGEVPRWAARLAWRRQRRLFEGEAAARLPTPRLAAGRVLAALAGVEAGGLARALTARRRADGGLAAAEGAGSDLLSTAAGRFADAAACGGRAEALGFVEACWLEDGLFGASPAAERGDAEHTFYGLLALGTCRR